jgi:hypothetical protein
MDEDDRRGSDARVPRRVMAGPPWGNYVDPDIEYIRGQLGSVGSGALGGRSFSDDGGFVTADPAETKELIEEAHRILTARAEGEAGEHAGAPDAEHPDERDAET